MKIIVAILLALCLCGCGRTEEPGTQPVPTQTETVAATEPTLTPEGYYVYSYTWMDGTIVTKHRIGSKKGVLVWEKYEYTDGSGYEKTYNDQGELVQRCEICVKSDGTVEKTFWDAEDWLEGIMEREADGSYYEQWYTKTENGQQLKKSATEDPAIGRKTYWEFYENGNVKYQFIETKEYTEEIKKDEEGYCTYYYYSDEDGYSVECTADETGRLVKGILMGNEVTDLAVWAEEYNFRS